MTPFQPRPARGVGRRQFSPGTDEEWDRAFRDPNVQRAFRDPVVSQALIGMMPGAQPAQGFASGGSVGIPDAETVNQWQQLQDAMKSELEPQRYQTGGLNAPRGPSDLQGMDDAQLADLWKRGAIDTPTYNAAWRMNHPGSLGAPPGTTTDLTLPGATGAQNLSGLANLTGPATMANSLAPAALAGLAGLGVTGKISPMGRVGAALLSAAMAYAGNRIIRHYAQQHQQNLQTQGAQAQQSNQSAAASSPPQPSTTSPSGVATTAQVNAIPTPGSSQSTTDQTTGGEGQQSPTEKQQAIEEGQAYPEAIARRNQRIKQGAQYNQYGFRTDRNQNEPGYPQPLPSSDRSYPRSQAAAPTGNYGPVPWPLQIPGAENAPVGSSPSEPPPTNLPGMEPTPQARTPADYRAPADLSSPASRLGPADPGTPLGPPGLPPTREHPHGVPDPTWQAEHPEDYPLSSYARGGEAHGDAAQDRAQMLGILREKGLIKKAQGGQTKEPILYRRPPGHAIPVLHTTIVILAKPKDEKKSDKKSDKKARGGNIEIPAERLDTRARKPRAIPPKRGPQNGDQYAPYQKGGHVQVPRGSGVATRGKRFSGIY